MKGFQSNIIIICIFKGNQVFSPSSFSDTNDKKDRLFHKPVFLFVLFFQAAVSGISKLSANDSENAEVKAFCKDSINSLNRL